ncbi:sensor histidine kinase [Nocardia sp. NPDC003345]
MTSWQVIGLLGWVALAGVLIELVRQRRMLRVLRRKLDAADRTVARQRQELEVDSERLLIARELHDVVAHNLSLINVQSGMALQQVENKSAKAAGTVAEIKTTSRNALEDVQALRHAIQAVEAAAPASTTESSTTPPRPADRRTREKRSRRSGFGRWDRPGAMIRPAAAEVDDRPAPAASPPPPREPDPTLADLDELLRKPRATGLTVQTRVLGTATPLPGAIDEAAAQIVRESLANVILHAPGSEATVTVRYTTDSVDLTVDNTRPTGKPEHTGPTRGMGIIAMREQAHALGGALTAGPKPSGGYRVAARLPSRPLRVAADPDAPVRSRAGSEPNKRIPAPAGRESPSERVETGPTTVE